MSAERLDTYPQPAPSCVEALAARVLADFPHSLHNTSLADMRILATAALALGPCVAALEEAEVLAMLVRDWADHADISCRGETCAWCYSAGAWPKITAALSAARAACAVEGMQASRVSDVKESDDLAAGDAHGR